MRREWMYLAVGVLGVLLVARVWASSPVPAQAAFQGYWMGVDHVDGGDSRRSLIQLANGRYSLAGRDTVLTLCDSTDRGFASFSDGVEVGRDEMQSNALTIACANGATVVLNVRYELIGKGVMIEHTTRQDGTPVSSIVFHKVSQD